MEKVEYMEEKVSDERNYQIICRFGCSHVKMNIGSFDFFPAKKRRKVQRRFTSNKGITYHY